MHLINKKIITINIVGFNLAIGPYIYTDMHLLAKLIDTCINTAAIDHTESVKSIAIYCKTDLESMTLYTSTTIVAIGSCSFFFFFFFFQGTDILSRKKKTHLGAVYDCKTI